MSSKTNKGTKHKQPRNWQICYEERSWFVFNVCHFFHCLCQALLAQWSFFTFYYTNHFVSGCQIATNILLNMTLLLRVCTCRHFLMSAQTQQRWQGSDIDSFHIYSHHQHRKKICVELFFFPLSKSLYILVRCGVLVALYQFYLVSHEDDGCLRSYRVFFPYVKYIIMCIGCCQSVYRPEICLLFCQQGTLAAERCVCARAHVFAQGHLCDCVLEHVVCMKLSVYHALCREW